MADFIVTSSDWQSIRSLAEQGVDYTALAEQYGVSYGSIAVRSHREGWFTPDRVKIKLSKMSESIVINGKNTPSEALPSEKKDQILAETWQQKADSLRVLSFETAVEAIKRSRGIIAIETASDLKAAVHVARQATGVLDTEAPAISLNLGGSGGFFESAGPVYEAVSDPVEPITLEDCGV
jgi:hypothetical protein